MTYAEKVYAMTGAQLVAEAEKVGAKVNKKGNTLKEAKATAADKIIAAYEAQQEVAEAPAEVEEVKTEVSTEHAEKEAQEVKTEKKARRRTKKTFEELLADISLGENMRAIRNKKNEVIVKIDKKQIFRYTGPRLVVIRKQYVEGLEYTEHGYGNVLAPTEENMRAVIANAIR